jgi:hypothetical protein
VFVGILVLLGGLLGGMGCNGAGGVEDDVSDAPEAVQQEVEGSLRARIEAIHSDMPREGSDRFARPSADELAQWRTLIDTLAASDTAAARSLIAEQFPSYALIAFTDTLTSDTYYLLQEAPTVETGWGTVVMNPDPDRNLAVQVPHPQFELNTHVEGADLFRRAGARVLVMAGTHRCANRAASSCDGRTGVCGPLQAYRESDMAHIVEAPFQVTHEAMVDRHPEITAFSLHGTGRDNCETVFLSSGVADDTPEPVRALRQALVERGVRASIPQTSSCPLVGSTNVQGRYTNGSPTPCTQEASGATGRFIHVEQRREFRASPDRYEALIDAVIATFGP